MMILRRSQFVHAIPLGPDRVLVVHALTQLRIGLDMEAARLVDWFATPRRLPDDLPELLTIVPYDQQMLAGAIGSLMERGVLTDKSMDEERDDCARALGETQGRDPGEMLARFRRKHRESGEDYWSLAPTRDLSDLGRAGRRVDVLLLGDCDVQMEANFLGQEGAKRGLDLRVAASFQSDPDFVSERAHDIVVLGASSARAAIGGEDALEGGVDPIALFVAQTKRLLVQLRARTSAPILIDALAEPTVSPLGMADRGLNSHRNKFRRANLALEDLACEFVDVHIVDTPSILAAHGSLSLLDDGLTGFTHFGSPGWMLQRPASERAAVHDAFPDIAPLEALVRGDPYLRERAMAAAHVDLLITALGIDQKKCVILDLDGVLWPGVLAETGAPFAWTPELSGPHSYIGLYFGLHEALKALQKRGVVLAAVSKNDEAVVQNLWTYPDCYPRERLLTPDDFVAMRINWRDKSENIRSIADELGFALEAFLFIDDHPIERERVRMNLPQIEVWGEDPFALRRRLLSDPRLQQPRRTNEAADRTRLVKAQLDRARLKTSFIDESDFRASLDIRARVESLAEDAAALRVHELFARTTQFNATSRSFTPSELIALSASHEGAVFTLHVADRFGDHGLVGAAVIEAAEIVAFVMSCRVIGMGVEQRLLERVLSYLTERGFAQARGIVVETPRNAIVRNLYRDAGFENAGHTSGGSVWTRRLGAAAALSAAE